ncbi:MAG: hypothetical protein EU548_07680, partial [Promethearchaeota archaeon]
MELNPKELHSSEKFTPLSQLTTPYKVVSVCGIITQIKKHNHAFKYSNGKQGTVSEFILKDNTGQIRVVVWNSYNVLISSFLKEGTHLQLLSMKTTPNSFYNDIELNFCKDSFIGSDSVDLNASPSKKYSEKKLNESMNDTEKPLSLQKENLDERIEKVKKKVNKIIQLESSIVPSSNQKTCQPQETFETQSFLNTEHEPEEDKEDIPIETSKNKTEEEDTKTARIFKSIKQFMREYGDIIKIIGIVASISNTLFAVALSNILILGLAIASSILTAYIYKVINSRKTPSDLDPREEELVLTFPEKLLFEHMREIRLKLAREEEIPPYCVFWDK